MTPHELELLERGVEALERIAAALERKPEPINVQSTERVGPLEIRHTIYGEPAPPRGVVWSEAKDAFFNHATGEEMPIGFYKAWFERRAEFAPAIPRPGAPTEPEASAKPAAAAKPSRWE